MLPPTLPAMNRSAQEASHKRGEVVVPSGTYGRRGPNTQSMGELVLWRRAGVSTQHLVALSCSPSPLPPKPLVLKVISFFIVKVLFIFAIAEFRGASVTSGGRLLFLALLHLFPPLR